MSDWAPEMMNYKNLHLAVQMKASGEVETAVNI